MQSKFTLELLQAVSDWQRGGSLEQSLRRGQKLKQVSSLLPAEYRACDLVCYRQVALPKDGVWSLIGDEHLPEKISSWTLDIEVAKSFKGGVPPDGQGFQGTILFLLPQASCVIVNLRELYKDAVFCDALEQNKSRINGYYEGAGRYENSQSEVVLEIDKVAPGDVYSLGGHSSPLDALVAQAADLVYGRPSTYEEREALLLKAQDAGVEGGARWLTIEATKRVLEKTKPQAAELKRLQEIPRS